MVPGTNGAREPSFQSSADIHVRYEKVGDFWLPARNETNTQLRIVGHSLLTIVYQDYEILHPGANQIPAASGNMPGCVGEPAKLSLVQ